MAIKVESEEVNSKFKGQCPLCGSKATFQVVKKGMLKPLTFSCPNCKAVWEYWEDWDKPPTMKGACLLEVGDSGRGLKLLGAYLTTAFWQVALDDAAALDRSTLETHPEKASGGEFKRSFPWARLKRKPSPEKPSLTEPPIDAPTTLRFTRYNMELYVPAGWRVIGATPNLKWEGKMDLQTQYGFKINLMWKPLVNVRDKYATPTEFVNAAINDIEKKKDVELLKIDERKTTELSGHSADFCHFSVTHKQQKGFGGLTRRQTLGRQSVHMVAVIYCEESLRYFIIYTEVGLEGAQKLDEAFNQFLGSFKCHLSL